MSVSTPSRTRASTLLTGTACVVKCYRLMRSQLLVPKVPKRSRFLKATPAMLEDHIVRLFAGWASAHPETPEDPCYHAVVLRRFGRMDEAMAVQQRVSQGADGARRA